MKVKNIMFSGFAAAVFATVCGAAVAADVSLISKDYADAKLQAKLTEGQGINIAEQADGTTTISADVDLSTLATKESVEALGNKLGTLQNEQGESITVQAALAGKQDTLTTEQQAAIDSGIDSEAVAQITTNKNNISGLTTRMTEAESDIQANTEAINTLSGGNGSEGVASLMQDVKDNTADIAKLNADAQTEGSVAKSIADALANGNYVDETELTQKGYQTAGDVETAINNLNLGGNYQAKLDDTQMKAVNSGVDSDKVAAIATNTQAIADNAAEIAKKVSVVTTAGTYLVNFDATGAVSYAPIKILDKDGNEITLNGESAVKPSAN
ncbi:MAG: hypothetical protein J6R52_03380 [Alphaproteobacteria bacterium]|nr:hypothetical protein [Alphaproteobacteria bacterium]